MNNKKRNARISELSIALAESKSGADSFKELLQSQELQHLESIRKARNEMEVSRNQKKHDHNQNVLSCMYIVRGKRLRV
jgi:hypothetical protein